MVRKDWTSPVANVGTKLLSAFIRVNLRSLPVLTVINSSGVTSVNRFYFLEKISPVNDMVERDLARASGKLFD